MGTRLSQVLLTNDRWIDRCVSRVDPAPFGIEWGSGKGALTAGLVAQWERGLSIELDQDFCVSLAKRFNRAPWAVVRADLLDYPLIERTHRYPLVGNLPYHVTGPALMKILRHSSVISSFQGLLQWEVAERLMAEPGDSNFRGVSLLYQWAGSVTVPFRVPSEAFNPRPDVDSAWVEFRPDPPPGDVEARASFARRIFRTPRKTLINNLTGETEEKDRWRNWMEKQGWDHRRRPQSLKPGEFEELFEEWSTQNKS